MLNVFENLHRAIAKPALTKILDNLADKYERSTAPFIQSQSSDLVLL
jgi:hypothetical protein